jgi:hypothetical protein
MERARQYMVTWCTKFEFEVVAVLCDGDPISSFTRVGEKSLHDAWGGLDGTERLAGPRAHVFMQLQCRRVVT